MRSRGQAVIELVVVVPLVLALAVAVASAIAAAGAAIAAEHAADRGLIAAAAGADPITAARAALPHGLAAGARVRLDGRVLTVRVDPAGPVPPIEVRQAVTR
jgi:hypothetical protein